MARHKIPKAEIEDLERGKYPPEPLPPEPPPEPLPPEPPPEPLPPEPPPEPEPMLPPAPEPLEPGMVPLRAPDGCTNAVCSRAYNVASNGLFYVLPADAEVFIERYGFRVEEA